MLPFAILLLFARMPANRGWIKKDFRTLHRSEARAFGIPLVPADQHPDLRVFGAPGFESKIARREIKFFVEERVIGNVHLAVDAQQRTVRVDDRRGVVIYTGRTFLEERRDNDGLVFARQFLKRLGARAG